jgi:hypothetical protein
VSLIAGTSTLPDDYGLTQPGRRTSYNPVDQHRRKWLVSIELTRKGGPALVGAVIPCFDDPLKTPQQYITLVPGRMDLLQIDYDRWAMDQQAALDEWTQRKDEFGRDLYEDRYDPEKPVEELPGRGRELLRLVGKPPLHPDVVRRAQAGEKALLKGAQPERKRGPKPKVKGRPAKPVRALPAPVDAEEEEPDAD